MQQLSSPTRALFIRIDKIGDLVLSLNADGALPHHEIHWWIHQGLGEIAQASAPPRQFTSWPKKFSLRRFFEAVQQLKKSPPLFAVFFHGPAWIAWALWYARVPVRIGRASQWWSFLVFNAGVRQRRSLSEAHESTYNYDLIKNGLELAQKKGLIKDQKVLAHEPPPLRLNATPHPKLIEGLGLPSQGYVIVHPGMAGSAWNWPSTHYLGLIEALSRDHSVVITGTAMDASYLEPLKNSLASNSRVIWLDGRLDLGELLSVLKRALLVVAPSTGVLHLAASLERPSLGLYSPLRAHHPQRWGPQGPFAEVLVPNEESLQSSSTPDAVMSRVSIEEALQKCRQLLGRSKSCIERI